MDQTRSLKEFQKKEVVEVSSPLLVSSPLVSVCVFAYNHEGFIRQALDSVLSQRFSGGVEIVIGEDESRDKTREIVLEYADRFPEKIRVLLHSRENNISVNGRPTAKFNVFYCMSVCRGKYIAFLDGDDFWTDDRKLERQVEVLENHSDIFLVAHKVEQVDEGGNRLKKSVPSENIGIFSDEDLAKKGCFINTGSVCFRNPEKNWVFPEWHYRLSTGDYGIFMDVLRGRKLSVLKETMSAYRLHGTGIWSSRSELEMYLNIADNLIILSQANFDVPVKKGFVIQNRKNFRSLLSAALFDNDYTTIERICEFSKVLDPEIESFFLKEVLQPYLNLMSKSKGQRVLTFFSRLIKSSRI